MNQELPQYKCHKVVRAARVNDIIVDVPASLLLLEGGVKIGANAEWMTKHKPQIGGYFVQYEDGYASFSPAEAFEGGYTKMPSDFRGRVVAERDELRGNLARLLAFFATLSFEGLPDAEKSRLRNQARFMDGYAAVLEERIAAFA